MEYFCLFYCDAVMEFVEDLGLGFIYYVTMRLKSLLNLTKVVFEFKKAFNVNDLLVFCFSPL